MNPVIRLPPDCTNPAGNPRLSFLPIGVRPRAHDRNWFSRSCASYAVDAAGIRIGYELQILFDRVIADRYVNQCSTLKSRDKLVVFDRIDGDATVAQPQH